MSLTSLKPADIARQIENLERAKREYDASYKDFLRGQEVQKAEQAAQKMLVDAKKTAEEIIKAAQDKVKQIDANLKESATMKARSEGHCQTVKNKEAEIEVKKIELKAKMDEVTAAQEQLKKELAECNKLKKDYDQKLGKIKAFVGSFDANVN